MSLERADIPVSFVSGAAAALCGFLLIGSAYRPQRLTLAGIVLRYVLFSILYAAGLLILYWRVAVPIWAPLFMIACLFFGREARAQMIVAHRP